MDKFFSRMKDMFKRAFIVLAMFAIVMFAIIFLSSLLGEFLAKNFQFEGCKVVAKIIFFIILILAIILAEVLCGDK